MAEDKTDGKWIRVEVDNSPLPYAHTIRTVGELMDVLRGFEPESKLTLRIGEEKFYELGWAEEFTDSSVTLEARI